MTTDAALLDAIWEQPHDDLPRLAYADWLDEAGGDENAARADLIRTQVDLARLPGDDPRFDALEARENELLQKWEKPWWKAMPRGCRKGYFSRGLPDVSLAAFSVRGMVKLGGERLRAAPLWHYHYGVFGTDMDALLGWPWLHRLSLFAMRPPYPDDWVDRLVECDNLRNVADLALSDGTYKVRLTPEHVKRLLDGWADRPLRSLSFTVAEKAGDVVAAGLADHHAVARLRRLDLRYTGLTPDGLALVLKNPHLGSLIQLSVDNDPLKEDGLTLLLAWPGFARLRWLNLGGTGLTNAGAERLAGCPAAAQLRTLFLNDNRIGVAGARALAESPHLERVEYLGVYNNPLYESAAACEALRERFGKRVRGLPDDR
jgi:uncharacterized protein (TIGR02996 family)